jgi:F-type H+-transporting ATPase subunit delta
MKLTRESRREAKALFDLAMIDGRLNNDRLLLIADELLDRKPRNYVQMLKFITRLARLESARHHAIVESAAHLSETVRKGITTSLEARFGKISTSFRTNPHLLGGLRVQLGSNVWDGSVRSRLESITLS